MTDFTYVKTSNISHKKQDGSVVNAETHLKEVDVNLKELTRKDDLLNSDDDAKGSSLVGWKRSPLTSAINNVHEMLDAQAVNIWEFAYLIIDKPTANNPSTWDWTPALQAAVDTKISVFIPAGNYPLKTPVTVTSNTHIYGTQGRGAGFYTNLSVLVPTTTAITPKDFKIQYSQFIMTNIGFSGGTVQMDLGLFHEVDILNCSFFNPSIGALVVVRGEKHRIERCRIDPRQPGIFGFSLGRWEDSVYTGYTNEYFGSPGAWFDRATLKDIYFQSGGQGYFKYAIKTNVISNSTVSNVLLHGSGLGGEINFIYVQDHIQQSTFIDVAPDQCGTAGNIMPAMFDFKKLLNCTLINVSPSFAGNNFFEKGISGELHNTTLMGCDARGDNIVNYGIFIPANAGQCGTLISCNGAVFYNTSITSELHNSQIVSINCRFSKTNITSSNCNTYDQSMIDNIFADSNGTNKSVNAEWGVRFSNGGGNSKTPFLVKTDEIFISNTTTLKFTNDYGRSYPQVIKISGNNISPEGNITAAPGSICMFYNGTTSGKIYIKESGIGNTGWVLK